MIGPKPLLVFVDVAPGTYGEPPLRFVVDELSPHQVSG